VLHWRVPYRLIIDLAQVNTVVEGVHQPAVGGLVVATGSNRGGTSGRPCGGEGEEEGAGRGAGGGAGEGGGEGAGGSGLVFILGGNLVRVSIPTLGLCRDLLSAVGELMDDTYFVLRTRHLLCGVSQLSTNTWSTFKQRQYQQQRLSDPCTGSMPSPAARSM